MFAETKRWLGAHAWELVGRAGHNRRTLYGGAAGLRILTFHETGPVELEQLKRIVSWCAEYAELATPWDSDALHAGSWPHGSRDRVLITFDDGFESNYAAARWLASAGVSAIFFVVPSLIGRSLDQFVAYHAARGVKAIAPLAAPGARGLSVSQLKEMLAMGHRIAAHNFAHRDLGRIHAPADLEYEVGFALDAIAELTGAPCEDFAIAFGQPEHISDEAATILLSRCPRIYACHRGLNVPGRTPRFLMRDAIEPNHPFAFTRVCIQGGGDHHLADRARLMAARVGLLRGQAPEACIEAAGEPANWQAEDAQSATALGLASRSK